MDLFCLARYGLSISRIKKMVDRQVTLGDLLSQNIYVKFANILSKSDIEKASLAFEKFLIDVFQHNSDNTFDDISMLASVGYVNFNTRVFEYGHTISEFQRVYDLYDWEELGLRAAAKKIYGAIEEYHRLLSETYDEEKWLLLRQLLTSGQLADAAINKHHDFLNKLEDLAILKGPELGKWYLNLEGIRFKEIIVEGLGERVNSLPKPKLMTLDEVLTLDLKAMDILKLKLRGETLQTIGDRLGLTRERVRQKLKALLYKLPEIQEAADFKEIFMTYAFSKEDFVRFICPDGRVYEWLALFYDKGKLRIDLGLMPYVRNDEAKDNLLEKLNRVELNAKAVPKTKEGLIRHILELNWSDKQATFTMEQLYEQYVVNTEHLSDLQLPGIKQLKDVVNRCSFILKGGDRYYRFYPHELTDGEKQALSDLFLNIRPGAYSMNYIFDQARGLMEDLDIRDGNELHHLIFNRDLGLDEVVLGRRPEFVKGDQTKEAYIFEALQFYNGQPLKSFLDHMHKNFGLQKTSLASYLGLNFSGFLMNGKIVTDLKDYSDLVEKASPSLIAPYYAPEVFRDLVQKQVGQQTIDVPLIQALGYKASSDLVYANQYKSLKALIRSYFEGNDPIRITDDALCRTREFYAIQRELEASFKILKVADQTYQWTDTILGENYPTERFLDFMSAVETFVEGKDVFSLQQIMGEGFSHPIFSDVSPVSLDRLLINSEKLHIIKGGYPSLYSTGQVTNIDEILLALIEERPGLTLLEISDYFEDAFAISLTERSLYNRFSRLKVTPKEGRYYW